MSVWIKHQRTLCTYCKWSDKQVVKEWNGEIANVYRMIYMNDNEIALCVGNRIHKKGIIIIKFILKPPNEN